MKNFTLNPFSKEDTNFLKGIAILIIVLHNFFSIVSPTTGQNEFWFSDSYYKKILIILGSNPLEVFHVFFNFLGHYGVQAFIFISTYGLTLSYQNNHPTFSKFLLHRFDKIYPSFVIAAVLFIISWIFIYGKFIDNDTVLDLIFKLTLISNFIPGNALSLTGPNGFIHSFFNFI
jgi:peptidoglycan/LPS O-acetylase OafA/YrhL